MLTVLVIMDRNDRHRTLQSRTGFSCTIIAIAASISTRTTGFIFEQVGQLAGFVIFLAAAAAAATGLLWIAMPETKPGKYLTK